MPSKTPTFLLLLVPLLGGACSKPAPPAPAPEPEPASKPSASAAASTPAPATRPPEAAAPDPKRYAWLQDKGRPMPAATRSLASATPAPPGYSRVAAEAGTFAAWLRDLPLAAPKTPVTDWRGEQVHAGDNDYVEAVVAIDVGKADLQQSSDVILRLQAEWLWSTGRRDATYLAATKDPMSFASYTEGKRVLAQGPHLYWVKNAKPNEPNDHAAFRDFLDVAFTWANSTAVRMQSTPVAAKDVRAGDFFLQPSKGGFVVVVLDIAERPTGERVALLGQCLYPAMSIYVARQGRATPWFSLRAPDPILTMHTNELDWKDLRRLDVLGPK